MQFVPIKQISVHSRGSVYHLTVDKNRNFFANGVCVHNCDYRGELAVILGSLINGAMLCINPGDRIAQAVIQAVPKLTLQRVNSLDTTERGEGGFGSTGV